MHKKIGVQSCWGFGNFLFVTSLALSNIRGNKRSNELSIIEHGNCGYDPAKKRNRYVSDYFLDLFTPKLNIEIIEKEENFYKDDPSNFLYKGFNFQYNLEQHRDYIIDCLQFSEKSEQLCNEFLNKISYKDENKQYICVNIRDGDFKSYYNKIDEILDPNIFIEVIDKLDKELPIIINIIPQEDKEKYKKIFEKYINRIYFCNIDYPMFLPIIAKSDYCIIANSTFYWWGAFLNKKGKIFYPDPWFRVFNVKFWIPNGWEKIENKIKKENTIIHVGAHHGDEIPNYKKQYDRIIMIEADPSSFLVLKEKYQKEPNVELINIGVSDKKENISFYRTSNEQSSSFFKLNDPHIKQFPYVKQTDIINIETDTLDSIIKLNSRNNVLVIDVQGAELKVLNGALETLKQVKEIRLEINYEETYKGCCLMHEIDEFLYNNGFKRTVANFGGCQGEATYIKNKTIFENIDINTDWITIFDSDDPKNWTENSLPLIFWMKKHSIKTDKLKIEAGGLCEEIPMTLEDLGKITPEWNGYGYYIWNAFHLGVTNKIQTQQGQIIISEKDGSYIGGTGFGRIHYIGDKQGYSINGNNIEKTNFKISLQLLITH